jgi:hypothetical protein
MEGVFVKGEGSQRKESMVLFVRFGVESEESERAFRRFKDSELRESAGTSGQGEPLV